MILLVTVHLPGTSSEVHRGKIMCICMETFYMYICSHFQSYIKIYSSESEYTKVRIKRKELNDMWPLQLDDMVLKFSIFRITIIRHII